MPRRALIPPRTCFVYLISSEVGAIKIGLSYAPASRVREIQIGSPVKVALAHAWEFADVARAKVHERAMHMHLEWAHVHGEWHALDVAAAIALGDALAAQDAQAITRISEALSNTLPHTLKRPAVVTDASAFKAATLDAAARRRARKSQARPSKKRGGPRTKV